MTRPPYLMVTEDSDEDFDTVLDAAASSQLRMPIVRARSGQECLQQLQDRHAGHEALPALLLLDLNLPGDDGRDVLRTLRHTAPLPLLPVVVLSASANPRDLQFCYAHGANAYHVKPVDHLKHLQLLARVLDYWLRYVVLPG